MKSNFLIFGDTAINVEQIAYIRGLEEDGKHYTRIIMVQPSIAIAPTVGEYTSINGPVEFTFEINYSVVTGMLEQK